MEKRSLDNGTVGKFGKGLKVEAVSISYRAGDPVGCRITCFFCWDTF